MNWFKPLECSLRPWAKRLPLLARTLLFVAVLVITPLFIMTLPYLFIIERDILPEHCRGYLDFWIAVLSPWEVK